MGLPVLITVFAFSQTEELLPSLVREKEEIARIMRDLHSEFKHIDVIDPTPDKVLKEISENESDLCIFHISGHSNHEYFATRQFNTRAESIADQLSYCYSLKLVILNGCNSNGQLQFYTKQDIPCIVATNSKINDTPATDFAITFYRHFFQNHGTFNESFERAKIAANATTAVSVQSVNRDLGPDEPEISDDKWMVSYQDSSAPALSYATLDETKTYEPNILLFGVLLQLLPDVVQEYPNDNLAHDDDVLFKFHANKFLSAFPQPIGSQLSKLFTKETEEEIRISLNKTPFLLRINHMHSAYQTIRKIISAVLVAELLEVFDKQDTETGDKQLMEEILGSAKLLFDSDVLTFYKSALKLLVEKQPEVQFSFAAEINNHIYSQIQRDEEAYRESIQFFSDFSNLQNERTARKVCGKIEEKLALWVELSLIFCKCRLLSIRNISLIKFRQKKSPKYAHRLFLYMGPIANDYPRNVLDYYTSNTVILTNKERFLNKDYNGYLNLYPFLIDWNCFIEKATTTALFYPIAFSKNEQKIVYRDISESDETNYIIKPRTFIQPNADATLKLIKSDEAYYALEEQFLDLSKIVLDRDSFELC